MNETAAGEVPKVLAAPKKAPRPPWRTVARVRRGCTLAFRDAQVRYRGGEWITEPDRVAQVRGVEGLLFVDVASPEHLAALQRDHANDVAELRALAAELGFELVAHGTPTE